MNIRNNSKRIVRAGVFKALPYTPETNIASTGDLGMGSSRSLTIDPGDLYYVSISNSNFGPLPAGTNIARTGGVSSDATVTLTENDRIVVT